MSDGVLDRRAMMALTAAAFASTAGKAADAAFSVEEVVRAAAKELRDQFVDPDLANAIADHLLARLESGAYRTKSGNDLAARLTKDIRAIGRDQHLVVRYEPPGLRENNTDWAEDDLEFTDIAWGVQTAARLPGNIGLLRITHFPGGRLAQASERYGAAMTLLKDTTALIIDFTNNHGGGSDAQGYFMSYFTAGVIELDRINYRKGAPEIIQTSAEIVGPRYAPENAIYIATSRVTFSAGESIALDLKKHRNATLVGERTRGGASSGNFVKLPGDFRVFIPFGRSARRSWEGVGVPPDIETRKEDAVATAHRLALLSLMERESDAVRAQVLSNVANRRIENLSSFELRPKRP